MRVNQMRVNQMRANQMWANQMWANQKWTNHKHDFAGVWKPSRSGVTHDSQDKPLQILVKTGQELVTLNASGFVLRLLRRADAGPKILANELPCDLLIW